MGHSRSVVKAVAAPWRARPRPWSVRVAIVMADRPRRRGSCPSATVRRHGGSMARLEGPSAVLRCCRNLPPAVAPWRGGGQRHWIHGAMGGQPEGLLRRRGERWRRYGASGGHGSTRTEASLWVGWLGTEEQIAGLERAEAQNIRWPTRASTPASRRTNKCRLTHEQVPLYRSTSRVPVPCYGKLQFTPNDK